MRLGLNSVLLQYCQELRKIFYCIGDTFPLYDLRILAALFVSKETPIYFPLKQKSLCSFSNCRGQILRYHLCLKYFSRSIPHKVSVNTFTLYRASPSYPTIFQAAAPECIHTVFSASFHHPDTL